MKLPTSVTTPPDDAEVRRAFEPVICYPVDRLPDFDSEFYANAKADMRLVREIVVEPRDAEILATGSVGNPDHPIQGGGYSMAALRFLERVPLFLCQRALPAPRMPQR